MRAAVDRAFGQPLTIEELHISDPGHGEVKVKLTACAICHSDIMLAAGDSVPNAPWVTLSRIIGFSSNRPPRQNQKRTLTGPF